jgi:ATP-dependent Clp protease adaptor protein ClpS
VERMLRDLFGHSKETCHKMAETVDNQGKVVVLTTTKEHAELKRDQIIAYGKDVLMKNCKGSMHSTIEAAP